MNDWKERAKHLIKDKIGILFVISLIISLPSLLNVDFSDILTKLNDIFGLLNINFFIPQTIINILLIASLLLMIVSFFLTATFSLSNHYVYLKVANDISPKISDSFYGFKDFGSALKLYFLMTLYITLWTLLFIVPGIIKTYQYSMAPYILAQNPGMSAKECLDKSKEMTEGYKFSLFLLDLSFIGWNILVMLTMGILSIWVNPYYNTTKANAYLEMASNCTNNNDNIIYESSTL